MSNEDLFQKDLTQAQEDDPRSIHAGVLHALAQGEPQAGVDEPYFPSTEEAVELNQAAHELYGQEWNGLRAPNELESALNRAKQHYYYGPEEDPQQRLLTAAAKMAYGVGMNQPFVDGNKRTAFWLARHFLNANGLGHIAPPELDDEELADHIIGHGEGTHSEDDTINLFHQRAGLQRQSNILDPIHDTLDPRVWDKPAAANPTLKKEHSGFIYEKIFSVLEKHGYDGMERWLSLVLTGSLTTYQYSDDSDVDLSLFVDVEQFPEWSRAEMIGIMISECDGTTLPGTPFPLQCFVVPSKIKREDLYKPGLRSGYDLATDTWIVPPDRSRVHDVEHEMNQSYTIALENADKMDRLLRYEPEKAIQFWHQIHKRRSRDQRAGKGDYSPSNVTYKMLANRGLFPQISEISGEHIARHEAMAERTGDPALDAALAQFMMEHHEELGNIQDYQHPENAWGSCEAVAEACAEFLKARGFNAHAEADELAAWGYGGAQKSEEVGAGDFTYPEHAMVTIYNEHGLVETQIDFTAAQYGFKEFPKVEPGPAGPLIGPQQQG